MRPKRKFSPLFFLANDITDSKIEHLQYLFQIPGADTAAIAAIAIADQTNGGRLCGRVLASTGLQESDDTTAGTGTVCGK